jgi:hypothetical protein
VEKEGHASPYDPCSLASGRHLLHIDWSVSRDSRCLLIQRPLRLHFLFLTASLDASGGCYIAPISSTSVKRLPPVCPNLPYCPAITSAFAPYCTHRKTTPSSLVLFPDQPLYESRNLNQTYCVGKVHVKRPARSSPIRATSARVP